MSADNLDRTVTSHDRQPLAERLATEMVQRWQAGERPTVQEYLALHPELANDKHALLLLVYEEYCLREEFAEPGSSDDLLARFPQWREDFEVLFECHRLLEPPAPTAPAPDERPTLPDYVILDELGRGSQGVVYLATQGSLANRPVVLKITPRVAKEHLALARLQHTNIVPLYAVHDNPEKNIRTLCMPYYGGATLRQLMDALADKPIAQRTGNDLLQALDAAQAKAALATIAQGRSRALLEGATYVQAMCWMGACLADALEYAHERGLVHLDIKPTNVLFTADGQPMLLDFHSAQPPIRPGDPEPDWLGGTPLYMSPEQTAAVAALKVGEPMPATVDGRSDIFSLGLVLYESLGGRVLDAEETPSASAVVQLPVSPGLRDILARCLAKDARQRYSHGAALAEDLRCHLDDLPLRGVGNRNLAERYRKWRKRRPFALPLVVMSAAVLAAFISLGIASWQHVGYLRHQAQTSLWNGREQFDRGAYVEAADTFKKGLELAQNLPGEHDLIRPLQSELARAQRAALFDGLRKLADQLRLVSGDTNIAPRTHTLLAQSWQHIWSERKRILNKEALPLKPALEDRARADLLDAGLIWADLSVRSAPTLTPSPSPSGRGERGEGTRQSALDILSELEAAFGDSAVLAHQRLALTGQPSVDAPETSLARTPWEQWALGRIFLYAGKNEQAANLFEQAVHAQPDAFWPNFYQGLCAWRMKNWDLAAKAFGICIALAPQNAECYCNLGRVEAERGSIDVAFRHFRRALELNPHLAAAAVSRGQLHLKQMHYKDASADFHRALADGADAATMHCHLAMVHLGRGDHAAARTAVAAALRADPHNESAKTLERQLAAK